MKEHRATVFSDQQGIVARVCPCDVIALSIGHASLTLRKVDFLRLAQVLRIRKPVYVGSETSVAMGARKSSHTKARCDGISLFLEADRNLSYGQVVEVIDDRKAAGVVTIGVITKRGHASAL